MTSQLERDETMPTVVALSAFSKREILNGEADIRMKRRYSEEKLLSGDSKLTPNEACNWFTRTQELQVTEEWKEEMIVLVLRT